jgi:hypothetical protein
MKINDHGFMSPSKMILMICFSLTQFLTLGQSVRDSALIVNPFERKLFVGFGFNGNLTTVTGNTGTDFFAKPSLGLGIRAEYYPLDFLGISAGVAYQQRGAGVRIVDTDNSNGNIDSTFIERIRFNSVEVPLAVLLRTPKNVFRGLRLSASIGVVPMINVNTTKIVHSVDDGHHVTTDESANFWKNDLAWQLSMGPDIVSGTGIFQVHFVYARGTKSVFQDPAQQGYNQSFGFRISWLYITKKRRG